MMKPSEIGRRCPVTKGTTLEIRSMFSRCEEISPDMLHDEDTIDKGDFVILRYVLKEAEKNETKEYQHDHLAIIKRRYN